MRAIDLTPPAVVSVDEFTAEITAAMREGGVRRVLVTRGTQLAGIISIDRIIAATAATAELLNDLSQMLGRQYEYEQSHLEASATESEPLPERGCS